MSTPINMSAWISCAQNLVDFTKRIEITYFINPKSKASLTSPEGGKINASRSSKLLRHNAKSGQSQLTKQIKFESKSSKHLIWPHLNFNALLLNEKNLRIAICQAEDICQYLLQRGAAN